MDDKDKDPPQPPLKPVEYPPEIKNALRILDLPLEEDQEIDGHE